MHARSFTASPGRWSSPFAASILALFAAACAAGGTAATSDSTGVSAGPPSLDGLLPSVASLPATSTAAPPRKASATEIVVEGAFWDGALGYHEVIGSMVDETARFNASSAPGGPLSGYAYAIYTVDTSAYTGEQVLHVAWRQPLPPANRAWIGLSHYGGGNPSWEWHANPADGAIPVDLDSGNYHNGLGLVRIAIVTSGPATWVLDNLSFGSNAPPVADLGYFVLRADYGEVVTLDASQSYDSDGGIVKYEFDPEGDGSFFDKGLSATITHKYAKGGVVQVALRVTDNEGAVSTTKITIEVSWVLTTKGMAGANGAHALDFSAAGDLLCAGSLQDVGQGGEEAFVGKYPTVAGANGYPEALWVKTLGTAGNDFFTGVAGDDWGDCFAAGIFGFNGSTGSGVIVRLDGDGNLLWQKEWDMSCQGFPVCAVDSQNYIYFASEVDHGPGNPTSVFIAKLDNSGAIQWQAEYTNTDDTFMYNLCFDNLNEPYIAGSGDSLSGEGRDGVLIALNTTGGLRFDKYFNGGLDEEFTAIGYDGLKLYIGGVQEGGGGSGDGLLCASDLLGTMEWAKAYSTSPSYEGVYGNAWPLASGGCIMSGVARDSGGALEAMLLNVQPDGSLLWQTGFGLAGSNDQGYSVIFDGLGRAYFAGVLEVQTGSGFSELNGTLTDIAPASLVDASGSVADNSHSLAAASGSFANLTGETHGSGGAFMAQYFTPIIL